MKCDTCGRELKREEIGLSQKLINRGTEVFFCLDCLSERFKQTPEYLLELARYYRERGCTLFY